MDEALQAKACQYALQLINETRKDNKLPPLEHDTNLATAAVDHCKSMANEGYISHHGQDGDKPYHRYFRHGCYDHIMENIYSLDAEDEEKGLQINDSTMAKIIDDIHHSFCSQEAPSDYDLQNILSPVHTHVGIAIFATEQRLRYVEVYVDRYAVLTDTLPFHIGGSEGQEEEVVVDVEGTVFQYDTYGPFCCLVYAETHPGPLSIEDLTTTYSGTTYTDGSNDLAAVVRPWEIIYDKTTGVFHFPVRLQHAQQDFTYYMVIYLKPNLDSIPYDDEVPDLKVPEEGCIPVATWMINLQGYEPLDAEGRNLDTLHGEDDIFSQSSSKNIEEEMSKTYARRAMGMPEMEPLTGLTVAIGKGSLTPTDNLEANQFMPQERHERVTSYNLNIWFSRAVEGDEDTQVIEDILILGGPEPAPSPPEGYELLPPDLISIITDDPKDVGQLEEEFHAFLCVKRVPKHAAIAPIVDLVMVYGTRSFQMGSSFETIAFPEEVNCLFLANLFLCVKRKGSSTVVEKSGEEEPIPFSSAITDENNVPLVADAADTGPVAVGEPALPAPAMEDTVALTDGIEPGPSQDDILDPSLTPEQLLELEKKRVVEQAKRAAAQQAEIEHQRKQEILADMRANLRQKEEDRNRLLREQMELQKKLAAFMVTQKMRDANNAVNGGQQEPQKEKDAASAAENERQYADTLNVILDIKAKIRRQKNESDVVAGELQYRLDEKQFKADAIANSFRDFKREIALTSENSRTGKPIPDKVVDEFERWEAKKNDEMEKIRLKNIMLRMTLKKLEKSLRTKEQLAEGLHLIDFEQLKIENQTLSEKIEERNEELQKLRKKNTVTVQVLTHVKEKLQFVAVENTTIKQRLSKLDHDVGHNREKLRRGKKERDRLRGENNVLKQNQGFASSDLLVLDYEQRNAKLEMMRSTLAQLKDQHRILHSQIKTFEANTNPLQDCL